MGLYLYGCYSPKRNVQVALPDGKVVEACLFRYICKPYYDAWDKDIVSLSGDRWNDGWGYGHKMTRLKVAKIEKLWGNVDRPRYTIHVCESADLKERGLSQPIEGDLIYSSCDTPAVWLEENHGDIAVSRVTRTRGGLWVSKGYASSYMPCADPVKQAEQIAYAKQQYENAVAKVEGIAVRPQHAMVTTQEATQ